MLKFESSWRFDWLLMAGGRNERTYFQLRGFVVFCLPCDVTREDLVTAQGTVWMLFTSQKQDQSLQTKWNLLSSRGGFIYSRAVELRVGWETTTTQHWKNVQKWAILMQKSTLSQAKCLQRRAVLSGNPQNFIFYYF